MNKVQAIIGLGSNLDEPVQQIEKAFKALKQLPNSQLINKSPVYKSKAMLLDGSVEQPDYINAVALLETSLSAIELLAELQKTEKQQGRIRKERWGPRTLDLDMLVYGDEQINELNLQVPHVGIAERNFVLIPLQDMMGEDYIIPGKGSVAELVKHCSMSGLEKLTN